MDDQPGQSAPRYSADGRWWWDGHRWVAVQQAQQQPAPPRRNVSAGRKVLLAIVGGSLLLLMAVCTIAVASSSGGQKAAGPGQAVRTEAPATQAAAAAPTPAPTPAQPRVLLDLTGSGIKNSTEFDAPSHWKLSYTYDCANFGGKGNFQVFVEQGSTPIDAPVNELGAKGQSTTDIYRGGRAVHLSMNSECDWHVTATT